MKFLVILAAVMGAAEAVHPFIMQRAVRAFGRVANASPAPTSAPVTARPGPAAQHTLDDDIMSILKSITSNCSLRFAPTITGYEGAL